MPFTFLLYPPLLLVQFTMHFLTEQLSTLKVLSMRLSLVPRLLPSFCHILYKKRGESLDDLITCAMTYYACYYAWFW